MLGVALLMSTVAALAEARIYERCELARDLQKLGVDKEQIATWVCIAYHESRFDTAARNPGSGDHGLLQISELYWCGPGKACGAPCSAFRNEDISDDVKCAMRIYREHTRLQGDGFLAWVVYPHHCKQNAKKYIVDCDKSVKDTSIKFEGRARYLKSTEENETKPQFIHNRREDKPRPRYLAINSLFQEDYINEFERSYSNGKTPLDWSNIKVDNIDDLKLPMIVTEKYPREFVGFTTPPAISTTIDPTLIGIKPPSPRRIESNQFRRRKTFSNPPFLRNLIASEYKTKSKTENKDMPIVIEENPERKTLSIEDLSHNIFLQSKPSPGFQVRKISDFGEYNIENPKAEETSSFKALTYDDLTNNLFLKSLPAFNIKPLTGTSIKNATNISIRADKILFTTQKPPSDIHPHFSEMNEKIEETMKSLPADEKSDINEGLIFEDLTNNPFLRHILKPSIESSSTKAKFENTSRNNDKVSSKLIHKDVSVPEVNMTSNSRSLKLDEKTINSNRPTQRGNVRFWSNNDSKSDRLNTASLINTRSNKMSRQRSNMNGEEIMKYSSTVSPFTKENTPRDTVTAKPYIQSRDFRKRYRTEVNTQKTPSTLYTPLLNSVEERKIDVNKSQTTIKPLVTQYSSSRTEVTSTTPANFLWKRPTNVTPKPFQSTTQKTTDIIQATTAKTTFSIFDLYLKPSTRPPYKPLEFNSSFYKNSYKISIFSGGTTKAPPSFYTSKKPAGELTQK